MQAIKDNSFLCLLFLLAATACQGPGVDGPSPTGGKTAGEITAPPTLRVLPTEDFEVTGDGSHPAWQKTAWVKLNKRGTGPHDYETRIKVLYSKTGLYVHMDATDSRLTSTMQEDFLDLWTEDVFEAFLWTDERHAVYFEYEISPLGYELPACPQWPSRSVGPDLGTKTPTDLRQPIPVLYQLAR